jgi:hypothetical protein
VSNLEIALEISGNIRSTAALRSSVVLDVTPEGGPPRVVQDVRWLRGSSGYLELEST